MKKYRRGLRKNKSVGIPMAIYNRLGLSPGMEMDISIEEGKIIIEPIGFICNCCGKASKRNSHDMMGFCKDCADEIVFQVRKGMTLDCATRVVMRAKSELKEE